MKQICRNYYDSSLDLIDNTYSKDSIKIIIKILKEIYQNNLEAPAKVLLDINKDKIILSWNKNNRLLEIIIDNKEITYLLEDRDKLLCTYDSASEKGSIKYNLKEKIKNLVEWLVKGIIYKDKYNYNYKCNLANT